VVARLASGSDGRHELFPRPRPIGSLTTIRGGFRRDPFGTPAETDGVRTPGVVETTRGASGSATPPSTREGTSQTLPYWTTPGDAAVGVAHGSYP